MRSIIISIIVSALFAVIGTFVFSIDHLAFSSYALFIGPLGGLNEQLVAAVLLFSLAISIVVVHRIAERFSSERAAWSGLALLFVSAPIMIAPYSVSIGFLAAPLLVLLMYQLATRKYRLLTIAVPIALLFALGFGHYPLFVVAALLITAPLRPDPDPRLGELFLLLATTFVVSRANLPAAFSVERAIPFGLIAIALSVFAVFRVLSKGSRRADPVVAFALASLVLFILGDPIAALLLSLASVVLVSMAFEQIFSFFDVSTVPLKRMLSFTIIVLAVTLTLVQSIWFVAIGERMDRELAFSLALIEPGVVAIDERYADALTYYSGAEVVELTADEVDLFSNSRFIVPVLDRVDERFSRYVVSQVPPYVPNDCFDVTTHGVLVEVRIRCVLS